jgi:hypothetical protein
LDGERGIDVLPVKGGRGQIQEEQREREGDRDGDQGNSASREILWKQQEASGIRKQRRMSRLLQGPMRKYRKLQGPICKTKFPVDLKPK